MYQRSTQIFPLQFESILTGTYDQQHSHCSPFVADTIVLISNAGAAEYVGGALGEFVRIGDHNNRPHYKQRDTEGVTDHYLYYISAGWRVSPTLGGSLSWLKHRQDTDLPARANWRYYNGKKWLDDDGTLKLDYTTLSPCKLVRVASSGFWFLLHSSRLDDYRFASITLVCRVYVGCQ